MRAQKPRGSDLRTGQARFTANSARSSDPQWNSTARSASGHVKSYLRAGPAARRRDTVTRYLLDVNVLIALIDPAHVQHDRAHEWFGAVGNHAWATCPLTQNGVLRIVGSSRYPSSPGSPGAVAEILSVVIALGGHEFWRDGVSLLDAGLVDGARLLDSAQVTDSYLLALAAAHGGKLATFDRRLVADAVRGGAQALHLIP